MGSARGQGDRRNSGAVTKALGMQMVLVKTTGGSHDALRGVAPSASLWQCDEELMEVDVSPEAKPQATALHHLWWGGGGGGGGRGGREGGVPALPRQCQD